MTYSKQNSKKINEKIQIDLDIIKKYLINRIQNIEAIILVGSFGRGEGSVLVVNNHIFSINDYDLVIVTKTHKNINLNTLRIDLARTLKIRLVDISSYSLNDLSKIKHSMFSYDLKYASKIIYGNIKILDLIPTMKSENMPLIEGIRPLLLFLSSLLHAFTANRQLDDNQLFWNCQQISKSILGLSTAMLIFDKKYHPSYEVRHKLFVENFKDVEFNNLVNWATKFKLEPNIKHLKSNKDYIFFWKNINSIYLKIFKKYFEKFYNKEFDNWKSLIFSYKYDRINLLKFAYSFFFNDPYYRDSISINIAQLLLCIILNDSNNVENWNMFRKEYNKISNIKKIKKPYKLNDVIDNILDRDPNASIFKMNSKYSKIF